MLIRLLSAFHHYPSRLGIEFFVGVILLVMLNLGDSMASNNSNRRVQISLSVFPRIVALDKNFTNKLSKDGKARLVFIYRNDSKVAKDIAALTLQRITSLAGRELSAVPMKLDLQLDNNIDIPTAIFVSEPLNDNRFQLLLDYAIAHHLILFSPFIGDVERGASAGIMVTNRIRPYFNMNTLTKSSITIHAILLNMSKHYE